MDAWPFADPPNVAVITTTHATQRRLPILYVSHDGDDGGWQFHCGTITPSEEDAQVVSLAFIVKIDPSIREVADLPLGYCAIREAVGQPWQQHQKT